MKNKSKMLLFLLVVLLALLIARSIQKVLPHYLELRSQLKAENGKLSMLKQRVESLPELVNKKEAARREFYDLLEGLDIAFDDETSFLLSVNPPQSGLRITRFRPLEEEKMEAVSFRPFEIGVSGDYEDLIGYLTYLENLKALTEIRELKINSSEENQGVVKASFVVRLYKLGLGGEGINTINAGVYSSHGEKYEEFLPASVRNIFKGDNSNSPEITPEK